MDSCCCLRELVWLVVDFFDLFFAWLFVDFLDFFVTLVGEVPVSGAIVGAPPVVVCAFDWIGSVVPANNASKANPEISAFMRELLDHNNDSSFFSHSWG